MVLGPRELIELAESFAEEFMTTSSNMIHDSKKEAGQTSTMYSLIALAKMLEQMEICDHGTRGYCKFCHLT